MSEKAILSGQFLISEVNAENKVPIILESKVINLSKHFNANITISPLTLNTQVILNMSIAKVLYVKARYTSDKTDAAIRVNLVETGVSVLSNDIRCSELLLLNSKVTEVYIDNDLTSEVEIQIVAAG